MDYYKELEIKNNSSQDDIRSAYKKLVAPSSIIIKSLLGSKESSLGLLVELDETAL